MRSFRPFSLLAAAACFGLLFSISLTPSLYLGRVWPWEPDAKVGRLLVAVISALLTAFLALPVARFILRAAPVSIEEPPTRRAMLLGLLVPAVGLWLAWEAFVVAPSSSREGVVMWFEANAPPPLRRLGMFLAVLWAVLVAAIIVFRHLATRRLLARPFIMFLRKFSSFSDRTVMNEVLRRSPQSKPVVFLTPKTSAARDWNPFQIGFAGLRLLRPVRSMPVPVRAPDEQWESTARELLSRADVIVLDASVESDPIDDEIEMIESLGLSRKAIALAEGTSSPLRLPQGVKPILYAKSWRRAWGRLLAGLVVSPLAALATLLVLLVPAAAVLGLVQLVWHLPPDAANAILTWLVRALWAVVAVWVYGALFFRANIDQVSARVLSARLRQRPDHDAR